MKNVVEMISNWSQTKKMRIKMNFLVIIHNNKEMFESSWNNQLILTLLDKSVIRFRGTALDYWKKIRKLWILWNVFQWEYNVLDFFHNFSLPFSGEFLEISLLLINVYNSAGIPFVHVFYATWHCAVTGRQFLFKFASLEFSNYVFYLFDPTVTLLYQSE